MRREVTKRARVAMAALSLAALATGAWLSAGAHEPPPAPPGSSAPSLSGNSAPAAPPGNHAPAASGNPVPGSPAKARGGRTLSVADAVKDLDLIRPARAKIAEDFTLATPDGTRFRLRDQRGRVVFINFWATWCPPCREEMPSMERLYQQHREAGFVMVAVSADTNAKNVPAFVREQKLTFSIALDPQLEVANTYGVRALPSSFIVDKNGELVALALGPRAWDTDAAHSLVEGLVKR
jgi:peroxiredoxin